MNRNITFGGGGGGRYSPMIYEYLRRWQEDPTSRVFAPLAEAYRKAGMVDEAIEIAQDGVRIHPNYLGGRVALARALFDRQRYHEVIEQLEMPMQNAPDNLAGQRLLAESFLMTGRLAEALTSFKLLLYFAPMDAEAAKMVKELETQAYEQGTLVLRTDPVAPRVEKVPAEVTRPRLVSENAAPSTSGVRRELDGPRGMFAPKKDRSSLVPKPGTESPHRAVQSAAMDEFTEQALPGAIAADPGLKRREWIARIEFLQGLLLRVERYRLAVRREHEVS